MKFLIFGIFSLIIIFYVGLDLVYRREISILANKLDLKAFDSKRMLLGTFFFYSRFIKNSSYLISDEAQKSIRYFYPVKYYKFYESLYICKKIGFSLLILELLFFISFSYSLDFVGPLALIISSLVFFLHDYYLANKFLQVKNEIKLELPKLLTKLSLLIDSGITYRLSLDLIIKNGRGKLYDELKLVKGLIDNGQNEKDAYENLARISEDMLIKKFISLILQNIYKGDEDFSKNLEELKRESFLQKKNFIINQSHKAEQKLLFPNLLIFIGIMVMVMVPILLNAF
ncbi:MAG: hypothetical protein Q4E50_04650 [Tissierellia bacterium]|nr:hypothetical protein [Tissierellia bacterium]